MTMAERMRVAFGRAARALLGTQDPRAGARPRGDPSEPIPRRTCSRSGIRSGPSTSGELWGRREPHWWGSPPAFPGGAPTRSPHSISSFFSCAALRAAQKSTSATRLGGNFSFAIGGSYDYSSEGGTHQTFATWRRCSTAPPHPRVMATRSGHPSARSTRMADRIPADQLDGQRRGAAPSRSADGAPTPRRPRHDRGGRAAGNEHPPARRRPRRDRPVRDAASGRSTPRPSSLSRATRRTSSRLSNPSHDWDVGAGCLP